VLSPALIILDQAFFFNTRTARPEILLFLLLRWDR